MHIIKIAAKMVLVIFFG